MKKIFLIIIFLLIPVWCFAASDKLQPFDLLSGKERSYYYKVFQYTMENVKEGNSFKWNVSVGNGEIFVGKIYLSKSKSMCRDFKEIFAIGENKGKIEGVSCKRDGNNGWCRLKKENAHTCALEEPQGFFDQITNDFESTVNQSSEWWRGTKDWWYR